MLGLFLKNALRENGFDPSLVKAICLSSVVPSLDYSVVSACSKYFSITPLELKPGIKTGLKLDIKNPLELGADRIANAVGALHHFPNKNLIVIDFGTATTLCAISKERAYLGGAILPGFKISMQALFQNTAKLSSVEIIKSENALGKTTITNIQSGLYYGQLGAVKEIVHRYKTHVFNNEEVIVLATGGYAHLLENENLFAMNMPDLILHGLHFIWEKNKT
ncbi:MAG: hypothetical protein ACD_29C00482G0001 [uncultured bacterium]|nr:MAG: hypothetical protein ACD_29C00482G0001 [uncultured bacterium]